MGNSSAEMQSIGTAPTEKEGYNFNRDGLPAEVTNLLRFAGGSFAQTKNAGNTNNKVNKRRLFSAQLKVNRQASQGVSYQDTNGKAAAYYQQFEVSGFPGNKASLGLNSNVLFAKHTLETSQATDSFHQRGSQRQSLDTSTVNSSMTPVTTNNRRKQSQARKRTAEASRVIALQKARLTGENTRSTPFHPSLLQTQYRDNESDRVVESSPVSDLKELEMVKNPLAVWTVGDDVVIKHPITTSVQFIRRQSMEDAPTLEREKVESPTYVDADAEDDADEVLVGIEVKNNG